MTSSGRRESERNEVSSREQQSHRDEFEEPKSKTAVLVEEGESEEPNVSEHGIGSTCWRVEQASWIDCRELAIREEGLVLRNGFEAVQNSKRKGLIWEET